MNQPPHRSAQPPPAQAARHALLALRAEIGKAVVGQDAVITGLVIALLCRGHVLLEGVPGVAKTLLVRSLAAALQLDFKRVQFTPDLMPGDVTGSLVYDTRTAAFTFRSGPVFTNLLLADEINRTPPKTQAALLEAMEERQVTVDGEPRALPDPFIVAATQNPIEYEGTYQLPEAQLDRFLLKLDVPLPPRDAEIAILGRHAHGFDPRDLSAIRPVAGQAELAAGRDAVRRVLVADEINRTPPKTQAALLEAMEEHQVSVDGDPRALPDPFIVAATQNPIEYEGTYQLPEAQLDRFLLKLTVPLPPRDSEIAILGRHAHGFDPRDLSAIRPVAGPTELAAGRDAVRRVLVADEVLGYIVDIVNATRHSPALQLGVSPRGATALLATARSWSWLSGRHYVTPDDVKAMARPTLRHRVMLRPEAELEGATPDGVLDGILASVPVPR